MRWVSKEQSLQQPHTDCAVHLAILLVDTATVGLGTTVTSVPSASAIVLQANVYIGHWQTRKKHAELLWGNLLQNRKRAV